MCFSIPYKIIRVSQNNAIIEDGRSILLGKEVKAKKGDYLQILGSIAVGRLTSQQGVKVRRLIKKLNS